MDYSIVFIYLSRADRHTKSRKKSARGWCVRRENLLQNRFPVKFQDVKIKDPNFKHEIFVRIDMKHSYFSNYFIICLQSTVCCLPKINSCLCIIFVLHLRYVV